MEHIFIASLLQKDVNGELRLEKLGWYKLSAQKWLWQEKKQTQAQLDVIFDWCKSVGETIPQWMIADEE